MGPLLLVAAAAAAAALVLSLLLLSAWKLNGVLLERVEQEEQGQHAAAVSPQQATCRAKASSFANHGQAADAGALSNGPRAGAVLTGRKVGDSITAHGGTSLFKAHQAARQRHHAGAAPSEQPDQPWDAGQTHQEQQPLGLLALHGGAPSDAASAPALMTGTAPAAAAPGGSTRHTAAAALHALPPAGPCDNARSSIRASATSCHISSASMGGARANLGQAPNCPFSPPEPPASPPRDPPCPPFQTHQPRARPSIDLVELLSFNPHGHLRPNGCPPGLLRSVNSGNSEGSGSRCSAGSLRTGAAGAMGHGAPPGAGATQQPRRHFMHSHSTGHGAQTGPRGHVNPAVAQTGNVPQSVPQLQLQAGRSSSLTADGMMTVPASPSSMPPASPGQSFIGADQVAAAVDGMRSMLRPNKPSSPLYGEYRAMQRLATPLPSQVRCAGAYLVQTCSPAWV